MLKEMDYQIWDLPKNKPASQDVEEIVAFDSWADGQRSVRVSGLPTCHILKNLLHLVLLMHLLASFGHNIQFPMSPKRSS